MSDRPTGSGGGPVRHDDLDVTLAVRRELGAGNDDAVIGEFLDRIGSAIDDRVDDRVAERTRAVPPPDSGQRPSVVLGVASLVTGIPVTAVALGITHGSAAGVILVIVAWIAIAVVNLAHTRRT